MKTEAKLELIKDLLQQRDEINRKLDALFGIEPEDKDSNQEAAPAKPRGGKSKRGGARPCSICHKLGHNKKTCSQNSEPDEESKKPAKKAGRPKKYEESGIRMLRNTKPVSLVDEEEEEDFDESDEL